MNSVDSLLNQPFSSRPLEEKVEIKTLGRPMPNLNIVQTAKGSKDISYNRHFKQEIKANTHGSAGVRLGMRYVVFLACCLGAMIRGPGVE
jgi:hypothetical protein